MSSSAGALRFILLGIKSNIHEIEIKPNQDIGGLAGFCRLHPDIPNTLT